MPDVPLTAGPLSAAGPFPLLCSGLSLLPEPVLAAASVPPVLPLRVARSIRPAPAIRRSRTNLRPCGETLPPRLTQKKRRTDDSVHRFCIIGRSAGWRHPKPVCRLRTRLFAGAWNRTVCGGPAAVPEAGLLSGAGRRWAVPFRPAVAPKFRPLPGYSSSVSV